MKNQTRKFRGFQYGGTLLGLIIGLVVGLAIAVVVALAITKGSTPFTNKSGKQDKATEATPGQASDPNKPLYGGKEAAKEAAKDFAKEPDGTKTSEVQSDGKQDPKAVKKTDGKAESPADLKTGTAAKSDKPDAKAAELPKDGAAKTDVATEDKSTYYLQAGAFREQGDAETARAKLALLGVEARISERPSDTGTLYRVRIGPFSQVDAMNRVRSKLSENSIDVAVVRNPK